MSFIAVGILAGPKVMHINWSTEQIHLMAELGLAALPLLVCAKLDVKLILTLGTVAPITVARWPSQPASAFSFRHSRHSLRVRGVDFDPTSVRRWQQQGQDGVYCDAIDTEFTAHLPLAGVKLAIATMPAHDTGVLQHDTRIALIQALRKQNFRGLIVVTNHHDADT